MNPIARIIVTQQCNRNCPQCCNKFPEIAKHAIRKRLDQIVGYKTIIISGGEPLLDPPRTLTLIREMSPARTGIPANEDLIILES